MIFRIVLVLGIRRLKDLCHELSTRRAFKIGLGTQVRPAAKYKRDYLVDVGVAYLLRLVVGVVSSDYTDAACVYVGYDPSCLPPAGCSCDLGRQTLEGFCGAQAVQRDHLDMELQRFSQDIREIVMKSCEDTLFNFLHYAGFDVKVGRPCYPRSTSLRANSGHFPPTAVELPGNRRTAFVLTADGLYGRDHFGARPSRG